MTQGQILNEFRQLPLQQQLEVIQAALRILAEHLPVAEPRVNGSQMHRSLAEAASYLLADYTADPELTSFTALDGEPFYAPG